VRGIKGEQQGTPYAHHHLGVVERPMRAIVNGVRTLLADTKFPQALWVELGMIAVKTQIIKFTKTMRNSGVRSRDFRSDGEFEQHKPRKDREGEGII
jgi:hypothetical protein